MDGNGTNKDIVLWVLVLLVISFTFYFTDCLLFQTNAATLFHHLVIEVWEILLSSRCDCGTSLSCDFLAGLCYRFDCIL